MFCSNCGTKASGNFCSACGTALQAPAAPEPPEVLPIDWTNEIRYERLIAVPEVRDRIAAAGSLHRKQVSAEQFLATFDKLVPLGVSLEGLMEVCVPLYDRIGIRTGKKAQLQLHQPAGKVLVAVLCAMAEGGNELKQVDQSDEACVLHATIPSTIWAVGGQLVITVEQTPTVTLIAASTKIPGALYDWGRSKRLLESMFQKVTVAAAA